MREGSRVRSVSSRVTTEGLVEIGFIYLVDTVFNHLGRLPDGCGTPVP